MFFFTSYNTNIEETVGNSLVAEYYKKKINLNSFRRKSLNQFFYNIASKNQSTEFIFASLLLINPDSLRFLDFLISSFNTQLKNCNSVCINFISKKIQNFFLVPSSSNTFFISSTNIISLFLFLDFLLRLKINFLVKNISEVIIKKKDSTSLHRLIINKNNVFYSVLQSFVGNFVLPNKKGISLFHKLSLLFTFQFLKFFLITTSYQKKNVNFTSNI